MAAFILQTITLNGLTFKKTCLWKTYFNVLKDCFEHMKQLW